MYSAYHFLLHVKQKPRIHSKGLFAFTLFHRSTVHSRRYFQIYFEYKYLCHTQGRFLLVYLVRLFLASRAVYCFVILVIEALVAAIVATVFWRPLKRMFWSIEGCHYIPIILPFIERNLPHLVQWVSITVVYCGAFSPHLASRSCFRYVSIKLCPKKKHLILHTCRVIHASHSWSPSLSHTRCRLGPRIVPWLRTRRF